MMLEQCTYLHSSIHQRQNLYPNASRQPGTVDLSDMYPERIGRPTGNIPHCRRSRHLLRASSQLVEPPAHPSVTIAHVRERMICSTVRWFLTKAASDSVRASLGKNRPEYGSNRSSTTLSRSLADSVCRRTRSGSSGSGLVATPAQ